ncbi:hypothetical protein [Bradyrhizobium sp. SSUT77]|uniref:hypothetical protein n=1 Tax=Bradyrhizobium sp. SSUT77 TaxID=3040603 RepID=UPI00244C879C|nr:hypothetical protein [Bradyrhizobium sp. SSUT77]MDH2346800.1 hypothetical protein [Bradyrhizobium sp. SSUT77]
MSLSQASRALLERMRPVIAGATEGEIRRAITSDEPSALRDDALFLVCEGDYSAFFAPFDWINDEADIVIVGVTPGKQQALEALLSFRAALAAGGSLDDAARQAKSAASFKGGMRTLGARLMDHFALHRLFGLVSTLDLFGSAGHRAHYTSALRYPVLKKSGNYAGDSRIADRPFMRRMIEESLADELARLPKAWLVPFGPNALRALDHLAAAGRIDGARILGGLLHPGGQQWNRYNVQLDLVSGDAAHAVPGGAKVLRRSAALQVKVAALLPG